MGEFYNLRYEEEPSLEVESELVENIINLHRTASFIAKSRYANFHREDVVYLPCYEPNIGAGHNALKKPRQRQGVEFAIGLIERSPETSIFTLYFRNAGAESNEIPIDEDQDAEFYSFHVSYLAERDEYWVDHNYSKSKSLDRLNLYANLTNMMLKKKRLGLIASSSLRSVSIGLHGEKETRYQEEDDQAQLFEIIDCVNELSLTCRAILEKRGKNTNGRFNRRAKINEKLDVIVEDLGAIDRYKVGIQSKGGTGKLYEVDILQTNGHRQSRFEASIDEEETYLYYLDEDSNMHGTEIVSILESAQKVAKAKLKE